jgi:hypothetical protein
VPGRLWGAFSNVHDIPNDNIIGGRHNSRGPGGVCVSVDHGERWQVAGQGLPVGALHVRRARSAQPAGRTRALRRPLR